MSADQTPNEHIVVILASIKRVGDAEPTITPLDVEYGLGHAMRTGMSTVGLGDERRSLFTVSDRELLADGKPYGWMAPAFEEWLITDASAILLPGTEAADAVQRSILAVYEADKG